MKVNLNKTIDNNTNYEKSGITGILLFLNCTLIIFTQNLNHLDLIILCMLKIIPEIFKIFFDYTHYYNVRYLK